MNLADSEEMAAHLLLRGYALTDNLDEADLALVNTCTVRDHAEHRALSFLGRLRQWKREKEGRHIIFAGCAAQRLGEKLKKTFPYLDLVSGAREIDHFASLLDKSLIPAVPNNTPAAKIPVFFQSIHSKHFNIFGSPLSKFFLLFFRPGYLCLYPV